MKLLLNEWRKYFLKSSNRVAIPIILVSIFVFYYAAIYLTANNAHMPIPAIGSIQLFSPAIYICYYFINIIAIISASNILSSEVANGTIKFVLTRPYQRYKILLAKITAITILMPIFMILGVIIILFLQLLSVGHLPEISEIIKYTKIHILILLVNTVFFTSLALLLSSFSCSSSFITGFCFIYFSFGNYIWQFINDGYFNLPSDGWTYKLSPLNVNSYLTDLLRDTLKNPISSELHITLLANIVYTGIFLLIAILIFRRRDISLAN